MAVGMGAGNIPLEDIEWSVRWGQVLVKIKFGSTSDADTQLSRQECVDLVRGLQILNSAVKQEDRHGPLSD